MNTALAQHSAAESPNHLKVAARSLGGTRTSNNQDAYLALPDQGLFALSDGMGGHQGGQIASRLALDTLAAELAAGSLSAPAIETAIHGAHRLVFERARRDPALEGMGATLVVAWIDSPRLHCFHLGDSRAYRLRDFILARLTEDHRAGRSRLTRALGGGTQVQVDYGCFDWRPGDGLMLSSDGITDVLSDLVLTNTLVAHQGSPAAQAEALIGAAQSTGGRDDKTLILVEG